MVAVVVVGASLWAQESEEAPAAEKTEQKAAESDAAPKSDFNYYTLPKCFRLDGMAEVRKPGAKDWEAIEEGRFYPLGTSYRVKAEAIGSKLVVSLGRDCYVTIEAGSSFGTREQKLGNKTRTILLDAGTIMVSLPRNFPLGVFAVTGAQFVAKNQTGVSRYTYAKSGDGETATIRCVTGSITVEGRHFQIPAMNPASELKIRSALDAMFTGIYGISGDSKTVLEQGLVRVKDLETGEEREEPRKLEWTLSPKTSVRIYRKVAAIGGRMAVSTLTFDAAGALKNRCAFAEGRSAINTGELVLSGKDNRAALAKKAAEMTEEVPAADEKPVEEKPKADEKPADEKPEVDEKPADDKPADDKPAEPEKKPAAKPDDDDLGF